MAIKLVLGNGEQPRARNEKSGLLNISKHAFVIDSSLWSLLQGIRTGCIRAS